MKCTFDALFDAHIHLCASNCVSNERIKNETK